MLDIIRIDGKFPKKLEDSVQIKLVESYHDYDERYKICNYIWINRHDFFVLKETLESFEFEYNTGNEGSRTDFMYSHACIVIKLAPE